MAEQFNLLNWNDGHGYRLTHDWFRFPGKFHPPLVEHILRALEPNAVLDPMAGVGTVAVEAKVAGIPSLSLDIDPISTFFTKVKTTPISTRTLRTTWRHLRAQLAGHLRSEDEIYARMFRDIRVDAMRQVLASLGAADLERLDYWFRRYVLVDFARIDFSIRNGGLATKSNNVRSFFLACLISSVRRISLADPSPVSGLEITKQMRGQLKIGYRIDVFQEFERRVSLAIRRMNEFTTYLRQRGTYNTPAYVQRANCTDLLTLQSPPNFRADLVLFSPPYCNAIEYWRRHRLEHVMGRFLDEEGTVALRRASVGRTSTWGGPRELTDLGYAPTDKLLRALGNGNKLHKARVLRQYFEDMRKSLAATFDYLPSSGHCIIVVGDSKTGGRRIPTTRTIAWLGEQVGFNHVKTSRYEIKNRAMQFPLRSDSRIEREAVVLLTKP